MSARGQKFTVRWKTPEFYSDFLDDFSNNPTTGALATVTNEESISQSIRNLVMTAPGERPGRNSVGSKVSGSLFDPGTPFSLDVLRSTVAEVINNYEPRATNVRVDVSAAQLAQGIVTVSVTYQPINLPDPVTVSFPLQRVR